MNEVKYVGTLGELRELTRHLPDDTPLMIDREESGYGDNVGVLVESEHNRGDRLITIS